MELLVGSLVVLLVGLVLTGAALSANARRRYEQELAALRDGERLEALRSLRTIAAAVDQLPQQLASHLGAERSSPEAGPQLERVLDEVRAVRRDLGVVESKVDRSHHQLSSGIADLRDVVVEAVVAAHGRPALAAGASAPCELPTDDEGWPVVPPPPPPRIPRLRQVVADSCLIDGRPLPPPILPPFGT